VNEQPQWGIRIGRGLVTHFNGQSLVTWEQAVQAREQIEKATGEWGEIEKVYVLGKSDAQEPSDGGGILP
jgi:hypothetical protein